MVDNIEEFREAMKDPEFEKQVLSGTKSLADAIIIFRRLVDYSEGDSDE